MTIRDLWRRSSLNDSEGAEKLSYAIGLFEQGLYTRFEFYDELRTLARQTNPDFLWEELPAKYRRGLRDMLVLLQSQDPNNKIKDIEDLLCAFRERASS